MKTPTQQRIAIMQTPVFLRDYGIRVTAEYRVGPIVTCSAEVIKAPDGWIIDEIRTASEWRFKGHARAVLERIKEVSGMPVVPHLILEEARGFWKRMTELGINQ